ncbi:MAG: hypothetical protein Q9164_004376 [Protoblastenia rupestris]
MLAARSKRNQKVNQALREAPEREDERLTNATILQSDIPRRHTVLPDPDREARLAIKQANVANHNAAKEEERRNMLHTLYINAGSFITTSSQLDAVIDRVFDDTDQFTNDEKRGQNIWNLGFPQTVQEMLGGRAARPRQGGGRMKALDAALEGADVVYKERMRKIGEELTGGADNPK